MRKVILATICSAAIGALAIGPASAQTTGPSGQDSTKMAPGMSNGTAPNGTMSSGAMSNGQPGMTSGMSKAKAKRKGKKQHHAKMSPDSMKK